MTTRDLRGDAAVQPAQTDDVSVPTIIEFVLDETGSMNQSATIGGFNDFLSEQRNQPGECLLTLTKFDTRGLRNPYTDIDIRMVPSLTPDTYTPHSMTNLRDAIMARIVALRTRLAQEGEWSVKPNVLFVVLTDGDDNSSSNGVEATRNILLLVQDLGWTCVYLGPKGSDVAARDLGFPEGNIRMFEGHRTRETMQSLAAATTAYRTTVATATLATTQTDFFGAAVATR